MPILECPRRSLATFGWTPDESRCVAWACRRSWKRDARHSRPGDQCLPIVREGSRLERLTVFARIDEGGVILLGAQAQQLLSLLCPMRAQLFDHVRRQREVPIAT